MHSYFLMLKCLFLFNFLCQNFRNQQSDWKVCARLCLCINTGSVCIQVHFAIEPIDWPNIAEYCRLLKPSVLRTARTKDCSTTININMPEVIHTNSYLFHVKSIKYAKDIGFAIRQLYQTVYGVWSDGGKWIRYWLQNRFGMGFPLAFEIWAYNQR